MPKPQLPPGISPAKGGRPPNHTKLPAGPVLAALTTKISHLIEAQVERISRTLQELDRATEDMPIVSAETVASRIELTTSLAGMLKTLTQVQTARRQSGESGDEEGGGDAGGSKGVEEVLKDLMRGKR